MAITDEALWAAEKRLWLEGAESYDTLVAPDSLMVFPGIGAMDGASALRALAEAPRWSRADFADKRIARFGKQVAVLAYTATGRREGAGEYHCHCTSTHCSADDAWQLIQHQQTVSN